MKKIIANTMSFMLGLTMFIAGSAIADEATTTQFDSSSESAVVTQENSTSSIVNSSQQINSIDNPIFCSDINKSNEINGDCFCVKDAVSSIEEVDCLVASGIVSANEYDDYIAFLNSSDSNNSFQTTGMVQPCYEVGKDNELGGDCYCVQDSVTNMNEVDCLINSGIVGEDTRETYREYISSLNN